MVAINPVLPWGRHFCGDRVAGTRDAGWLRNYLRMDQGISSHDIIFRLIGPGLFNSLWGE